MHGLPMAFHDEVQDHLLALDPIAFHNRKLLVKLSSKLNFILRQIDPYNARTVVMRRLMSTGLFRSSPS